MIAVLGRALALCNNIFAVNNGWGCPTSVQIV